MIKLDYDQADVKVILMRVLTGWLSHVIKEKEKENDQVGLWSSGC